MCNKKTLGLMILVLLIAVVSVSCRRSGDGAVVEIRALKTPVVPEVELSKPMVQPENGPEDPEKKENDPEYIYLYSDEKYNQQVKEKELLEDEPEEYEELKDLTAESENIAEPVSSEELKEEDEDAVLAELESLKNTEEKSEPKETDYEEKDLFEELLKEEPEEYEELEDLIAEPEKDADPISLEELADEGDTEYEDEPLVSKKIESKKVDIDSEYEFLLDDVDAESIEPGKVKEKKSEEKDSPVKNPEIEEKYVDAPQEMPQEEMTVETSKPLFNLFVNGSDKDSKDGAGQSDVDENLSPEEQMLAELRAKLNENRTKETNDRRVFGIQFGLGAQFVKMSHKGFTGNVAKYSVPVFLNMPIGKTATVSAYVRPSYLYATYAENHGKKMDDSFALATGLGVGVMADRKYEVRFNAGLEFLNLGTSIVENPCGMLNLMILPSVRLGNTNLWLTIPLESAFSFGSEENSSFSTGAYVTYRSGEAK